MIWNKATLILSFVFGCYAVLLRECSDYQCALQRNLRIDCSPKENSKERCLARGCCFDNSVYDTIWCFQPLPLDQVRCPHPECQVLPSDRMTCLPGNAYITRELCLTLGCCYEETPYGTPSCFNRKVDVIGYTGFSNMLDLVTYMSCRTVKPYQRRRCGNKDRNAQDSDAVGS